MRSANEDVAKQIEDENNAKTSLERRKVSCEDTGKLGDCGYHPLRIDSCVIHALTHEWQLVDRGARHPQMGCSRSLEIGPCLVG